MRIDMEDLEMKKYMMVLFMVALIGISGCSKKESTVEATNTPTTPSSTQVTETTKKPDAKATSKTTTEAEIEEGIILEATSVQGTYVENAEQYPTTITFSKEGTFIANINICSGMIDVKGVYVLAGDSITLTIPEKTDIYYLDNDQPFEFTITETTLTNKNSNTLSCVDVGSYTAQ